MIAADEATAATAADGRPTVGGASLDASLGSLRQCQATTMRSLQLDSLAPGLRVEITGRLKSAHSTHLKMRRKNIDFGQVCDARALRIVIGEPGESPGTKDEVEACYAVVNAIHKLHRGASLFIFVFSYLHTGD
jgi:(p)ppGpp synthase/HD superfamily hydrolase